MSEVRGSRGPVGKEDLGLKFQSLGSQHISLKVTNLVCWVFGKIWSPAAVTVKVYYAQNPSPNGSRAFALCPNPEHSLGTPSCG